MTTYELELPQQTALTYAVVAGSQGSPDHRGGYLIGVSSPIVFGIQIGPAILPEDMVEYLYDRARQNGISFEEAYYEEMAARAYVAKNMPGYGELASLAKSCSPPHEWDDE